MAFRLFLALLARTAPLALLLLCPAVLAQSPPAAAVEGYWMGTFVRADSVQAVEVRFARQDGGLVSTLRIPDWRGFPPSRHAVHVSADSLLAFETVYGAATAVVDARSRELWGTVGAHEPPVYLHLRQRLRRLVPHAVAYALPTGTEPLALRGVLPARMAPVPPPQPEEPPAADPPRIDRTW